MNLRPAQAWTLGLVFLAPRLILLAVSLGATYDLQSYALVEGLRRAGQGLYDTPQLADRYPYLPAWSWILQGMGFLGRRLGGRPEDWFKLPGLLADAAMLPLLMALGHQRPDRGFGLALAWALSPLVWLITEGHGQFDTVVLACLMAAVYQAERPGQAWSWRVGLALGAAIAFKQWPLALLPFFWRAAPPGQKFVFLAIALGLPGLTVAPYILVEGWRAVASHLAYAGASGVLLPEALRWIPWHPVGLGLFELWHGFGLLALGSAWLWSWLRPWRGPLRRDLALAVLGLLVLGPAVSVQYLLWPLPFLLLSYPVLAWAYQVACLPVAVGFYLLFFPAALVRGWVPTARGPGLLLVWIGVNLGLWLGLGYLGWRLRGRPGTIFDKNIDTNSVNCFNPPD